MKHFLMGCPRRETCRIFSARLAEVVASLFLITGLLAQAASAQQLERAAITAGGGTASGGRFEATVALGEPAGGRSEGGAFVLYSGFLFPRPGAAGSLIFRDEFEALSAPTRAPGVENAAQINPEQGDDR